MTIFPGLLRSGHSTGYFDRFMRFVFRAPDEVRPADKATNVDISFVLKYFWNALTAHRLILALACACVLATGVLSVVTPLYYKDLFNGLGGERSNEAVLMLTKILLAILTVKVWSAVAGRGMWFALAFLNTEGISTTQLSGVRHILLQSYRFHADTNGGALRQRVERFSHAYEKLLSRILTDILPTVIEIVGMTLVLAGKYPLLAGVLGVWMVILFSANYFFANWTLGYNIASAIEDSRTNEILSDMFNNHSAIEAHANHEHEMARYKKQVDRRKAYMKFSWNINLGLDTFQGALMIGIEFALFYFGLTPWHKGGIDIGTFTLLQTYVLHIGYRMWSFTSIVRDLYDGFASSQEMASTLMTPFEISDRASPEELGRSGNISLKHVSFAFTDKNIIDDLSLEIRAGEQIALVGLSGAGKSTLTKLLYRVFDPKEGSICIDGTDIQNARVSELRRLISIIPQDTTLFNRTFYENIAYGKLGAEPEEVHRAAKAAHCHDFILEKGGYGVEVGERGIKLSGGERQRIVIARAFLRNSPILILDEATSSLDSGSEEKIQASLKELKRGRTTIVIAHRLSTVRRMDRILVLEKGRLVEDGSHTELLERKGAYWRLWTLQQNGFLPDTLSMDDDQEPELITS